MYPAGWKGLGTRALGLWTAVTSEGHWQPEVLTERVSVRDQPAVSRTQTVHLSHLTHIQVHEIVQRALAYDTHARN